VLDLRPGRDTSLTRRQIVVTPADYKLGVVASALDNYFRISDRGSSFWTEFSGGMTTFFSMCYIMVLNGIIIGGGFGTGIPTSGVFFATALASGLFTFLMGAAVNVPVALAPGMGLNGYFNSLANNVCYPPGVDTVTDAGLIANFPGGWPLGRGKYAASTIPACASWGKTSLPWSDAMGAVFIRCGVMCRRCALVGFATRSLSRLDSL